VSRRWLYLGVLLACGTAWGSTQALGKIAMSTGHGPFAAIFWQLVTGVVVLGPLALRQVWRRSAGGSSAGRR
jgi:hypothetical protein